MEKHEIPVALIKQRPTQIKHRQQSYRQILLPMILVGLIMVSAAVFMILSSSKNHALGYHYANISIIFLILPTLIISLLFGLIVAALCVGVIKIQEFIPKYSALADFYAKMITQKLREFQDDAVEPILLGKLIVFKISHFLQKLQILMKHNSES